MPSAAAPGPAQFDLPVLLACLSGMGRRREDMGTGQMPTVSRLGQWVEDSMQLAP